MAMVEMVAIMEEATIHHIIIKANLVQIGGTIKPQKAYFLPNLQQVLICSQFFSFFFKLNYKKNFFKQQQKISDSNRNKKKYI